VGVGGAEAPGGAMVKSRFSLDGLPSGKQTNIAIENGHL